MTIGKIWRAVVAFITRNAKPVDPEAAYRAKRAAQRRDQRARAKAKKAALSMSPTPGDMSPTVANTPNKSQEEEKERGTRITVDWRPDDGNLQLARAVVSDEAEAVIASFPDYWLARAGPAALRSDWQAQFRWWIGELAKQQRNKQLPLPLGARPYTITGDRNEIARNETTQARRGPAGGSATQAARRRAEELVERRARGAPRNSD